MAEILDLRLRKDTLGLFQYHVVVTQNLQNCTELADVVTTAGDR